MLMKQAFNGRSLLLRVSLGLTVSSGSAAWAQQASSAGPSKTLRNSVGMELVLIPAGSFTMGADQKFEEASDDETPQRRVTMSKPFYLGKNEVTQEQWVAVMGTNPSQFKGPSNPVEGVSWDDVQVFLQTLNASEGSGAYRLPTEAEWEYAARAGSTSQFAFGDEEEQLGEYAWYSVNSGKKTRPVGQKRPNAFGLYDMHGCVLEWCADRYGAYPSGTATDPTGPSVGSYRVFRGGSWGHRAAICRSAYRSGYLPGYRSSCVGFRVARSPSGG